MSIAAQEQYLFDSAVRGRGKKYFENGWVQILTRSPKMATAIVENGRGGFYGLEVEFDSRRQEVIDANCECPYFRDNLECKHLWAVFLALDAQDDVASGRSPGGRKSQPKNAAGGRTPDWLAEFHRLNRNIPAVGSLPETSATGQVPTLRAQQFWYVIDVSYSQQSGVVHVDLVTQQQRANGDPGAIKDFRLSEAAIQEIQDPLHANVMRKLLECGGSREPLPYYSWDKPPAVCSVTLNSVVQPLMVAQLAETGRLCWRLSGQVPVEDATFVSWDNGRVWEPVVDFSFDANENEWQISGRLQRSLPASVAQSESSSRPETPLIQTTDRPVSDIVLLTAGEYVLFPESIAKVLLDDRAGWLQLLQRKSVIRVAAKDRSMFVKQYLQTPALHGLPLPEEFCPQRHNVACRPRLRLLAQEKLPYRLQRMNFVFGNVDFLYDNIEVSSSNRHRLVWDEENNGVLWRDVKSEAACRKLLAEAGAQPLAQSFSSEEIDLKFPANNVAGLIQRLIELEWQVEAEGVRLKKPGAFKMGVTSGQDWFELNAEIDFEGTSIALPALLQAIRSGEQYVTLGDGSRGLLPEEWLRRYGTIAEFGQIDGDAVRFKPSQAMILDALLDAQENSSRDRSFNAFCKKLRNFSGIKPKAPPRGFQGELRDYQKEGLSWLNFLNEFRLGGCLADDMGLGKTIQVLALLEQRRIRRLKKGELRHPSLVVVPRSLVFNWIEEAARFTPRLKVVNYTGLTRRDLDLSDANVILTTYGTLRKDIVKLKDLHFDYVVLDEAQAIKNADSQASKACRLVNADHRLAMTGTPVENHLGELWSLFEFLNPGMLGASSAFQRLSAAANDEEDRVAALNTLAQALRPFLLRRTKQQVLTELPGKTEQTLFCEMPAKQKKLYNELRDYYRTQLTARIEEHGLKKSKIHVLEALLRLRQAACHPGLVDVKRAQESSAKLETTLEQLTQISAEGHKALVFSQFTSLLSIVKSKLDNQGIRYEYLDGRTRKRQAVVERFQSDAECSLFLISLKAGGHGLNLTAADYVFILDPWWNPAVEAQAVDRAHRMGQERHVFAYRLICKDTVEERILQMQQEKQQLADAIVSADASLIKSLSAEDLSLLLS